MPHRKNLKRTLQPEAQRGLDLVIDNLNWALDYCETYDAPYGETVSELRFSFRGDWWFPGHRFKAIAGARRAHHHVLRATAHVWITWSEDAVKRADTRAASAE